MRRPLISMNFFSPNGFAPRPIDILLERSSGLPGRRCISHDEYHVNRGIVLAIAVERRVDAATPMDDGAGYTGAAPAVDVVRAGRTTHYTEGFGSPNPRRQPIQYKHNTHR